MLIMHPTGFTMTFSYFISLFKLLCTKPIRAPVLFFNYSCVMLSVNPVPCRFSYHEYQLTAIWLYPTWMCCLLPYKIFLDTFLKGHPGDPCSGLHGDWCIFFSHFSLSWKVSDSKGFIQLPWLGCIWART